MVQAKPYGSCAAWLLCTEGLTKAQSKGSLCNLQNNFKRSNIQIIGAPEGEEEEKVSENFFEEIMKENFPSLAKEIDFQQVQEAQLVQKKWDPRKHTPRHIMITLPRIKDKERILKSAREKETVERTKMAA